MLFLRFACSSLLAGITSILLIQARPAFAEDDQRLYRDAYYLGRGDTGIAVADQQEALMYNPAGLAKGKGIFGRVILASPTLEFSDDARNMAKELQEDGSDTAGILRKRVGKNEHLGLYNLTAIVLRRAAIGIFNGETSDILIHKSPEAGGLEGVKAKLVTSNGAVFGLAQDFYNQRLLVGGNIKYMHRGEASFEANVTDADDLKDMKSEDLLRTGTGTSCDLGVQYKFPGRMEASLGATINNVGGTSFTSASEGTSAPRPLKQIVNLGAAIEPGTKISRFRLLAEYWDATNALETSNLKKVRLGAEISVKDMIGVTGGLSSGWAGGGFYVDLYLFRFDAGMYIQEMDDRVGVRPDKRLYFRLTAGF